MNPNMMNNGNMMNNVPVGNMPQNQSANIAGRDKLELGFYGASVAAVIGCFLPYFTISIFGFSSSINYFSNDGELADGIFVIIALAISAFLIFQNKGKDKVAIGLAAIAVALPAWSYIDLESSLGEGTREFVTLGIGFWLVIAGTIGALICSILLMKKRAGIASSPVANVQPPMNPQSVIGSPMVGQPQMGNQMYQQPAQIIQPSVQQVPMQKCQTCGAHKTGGQNCPSCGTVY